MNAYCAICAKDAGVTVTRVERTANTFEIECPRCGDYVLDEIEGVYAIQQMPEEKRYALSGVIRRLTIQAPTEWVSITPESIPSLLEAAPPRKTFLENVDQVLLFLADRTTLSYFDPPRYDKETDYPLLFLKDAREMNGFIVSAMEQGLLRSEHDNVFITPDGWKRVEELRRTRPDSRQAFVAMWFHADLDDAWTNGFQPGVEASRYFKALRVDRVEHNEKIDDRIVAEIRRSGLVVADFTGDRGGVYFEAGYAKGLGLPVIWTCQRDWMNKLHFDTDHYNHIVWETPAELKTKLSNRIAATVLPPK